MPSRAPDLAIPEALAAQRKRLKGAERRGVDVTESKRFLVQALLSLRARRLDEMGGRLKESARALAEEETRHQEEGLRRSLWEMREKGIPPERLAEAEAALGQRDLAQAETALARAVRREPRRRAPFGRAATAALAFESQSFTVALSDGVGEESRLLSIRKVSVDSPDALPGAVVKALAALRPRPRFVQVALPKDAHILSAVPLPPMPVSERAQAVRWKLAKLCDFEPEKALLASRPLGSSSVLGLMAASDIADRIRGWVLRAGLPVGGIFPPAETLRLLLPPVPKGESVGLLDIGQDASWLYVYSPAGLLLARDLGAGTSFWLQSLETPISSTRGTVRLSEIQSREVLGRFDISNTQNLVLTDGTSLNDKDILSLLRPALERLQDALARSLDYAAAQEGGLPVGRVFLSGLGAALPGLDRVLGSHAGIPVACLPPGGFSASSRETPSATDAVALSLLLARGKGLLDLAPPSCRMEERLFRGSTPALAAGVMLFLTLMVLGLTARLRVGNLEKSLQASREGTAALEAQIQQKEADLAALRQPPVPWPMPAPDILRDLRQKMPPDTVLKSLDYASYDPKAPATLLLVTSQGGDLARALAGHPRLGRITGRGMNYRVELAPEAIP